MLGVILDDLHRRPDDKVPVPLRVEPKTWNPANHAESHWSPPTDITMDAIRAVRHGRSIVKTSSVIETKGFFCKTSPYSNLLATI